MLVFFIVFSLTLLMSVLLPNTTDKQWRWKLFWSFLPLFLFGALRVNFGNDYRAYEEIFYEFHQPKFVYDDSAHAEIGFQFLCYVIPSFRIILVLNSFLLCLSLAMFIYRNVPKKFFWLAVILIFLNAEKNIYGSLVGMRNGFAVALFLLGSIFIQKRNILVYTGITAVAVTLHSSALFFMPLAYFVGRGSRISKKEIKVWIIVAVLILMTSLSTMKKIIEPYLVDSYESYNAYLEGEGHRGWLLTFTGIVLFSLSFYFFWNNRNSFSKSQNSIIRLGLLYIISTLLGSMAFRASYFFDMFFIGTLCVFIANARLKITIPNILCLLAVLMSFYSFMLWRGATSGNLRYDVYQSIISSMF